MLISCMLPKKWLIQIDTGPRQALLQFGGVFFQAEGWLFQELPRTKAFLLAIDRFTASFRQKLKRKLMCMMLKYGALSSLSLLGPGFPVASPTLRIGRLMKGCVVEEVKPLPRLEVCEVPKIDPCERV